MSEELAQKLGREDADRLLKDRKLVLLVDLDQTLVHTTNDNVPPNLKVNIVIIRIKPSKNDIRKKGISLWFSTNTLPFLMSDCHPQQPFIKPTFLSYREFFTSFCVVQELLVAGAIRAFDHELKSSWNLPPKTMNFMYAPLEPASMPMLLRTYLIQRKSTFLIESCPEMSALILELKQLIWSKLTNKHSVINCIE